jgi:arginine/lysine/ornithine decarboxylase
VKDIYLEQEFEVVVILFSFKDYLMSDFALKKKVPRVYGKRTSFYRNHQFNKELPVASTRMRSIIWMTKSIKNQRNTGMRIVLRI